MYIDPRLLSDVGLNGTDYLPGYLMLKELEEEYGVAFRVLRYGRTTTISAEYRNSEWTPEQLAGVPEDASRFTMWSYVSSSSGQAVNFFATSNGTDTPTAAYMSTRISRAPDMAFSPIVAQGLAFPPQQQPYLDGRPEERFDGVVIGEYHPEENVILDWVGFHRYVYDPDNPDRWGELSLWWPQIKQAYKNLIELALDPDRRAEITAARRQRSMDAIASYGVTLSREVLASERSRIAGLESRLVETQEQARNITLELRQRQQLLERAMDTVNQNIDSRVMEDFVALENHPRVESVDFTGTRCVITTTDDFRLTHPITGESRWLGQFRISIDLPAQNTIIENLSTYRHGRHHPHVTNGGRPCFGGHDEDFAQLMAAGELLLYFELLCQYLETLNIRDSWGAYGSYWFDVSDERPIDEVPVPQPQMIDDSEGYDEPYEDGVDD